MIDFPIGARYRAFTHQFGYLARKGLYFDLSVITTDSPNLVFEYRIVSPPGLDHETAAAIDVDQEAAELSREMVEAGNDQAIRRLLQDAKTELLIPALRVLTERRYRRPPIGWCESTEDGPRRDV